MVEIGDLRKLSMGYHEPMQLTPACSWYGVCRSGAFSMLVACRQGRLGAKKSSIDDAKQCWRRGIGPGSEVETWQIELWRLMSKWITTWACKEEGAGWAAPSSSTNVGNSARLLHTYMTIALEPSPPYSTP